MNIPVFTVSGLTRALADVVGRHFAEVRVEGEVGRVTLHRSGHWYLTLKDEGAVLDATVFRGTNRYFGEPPREGERVVATGHLDIYAPTGRYSLIVEHLERAGRGALQARLEALKRRLAAEGLFDPSRKRPLPFHPRVVGVVTSPTGAAFHDIIRVSGQRWPSLPILLSPCAVQGADAAPSIVAALLRLERRGGVDVVIMGRGGGSIEDLWAFNEEAVIRAIARCPIPVVSAVGHEVDVTLADLVADLRAATPSHAAELVFPDRRALRDRVSALRGQMARRMKVQVAIRRQRLTAIRLRHPRRRVEEARIRCDLAEERLVRAMKRIVAREKARLGAANGRLQALSPLAVLDRGYTIALKKGRAVRHATELDPTDALLLRFADGTAQVEVQEVLLNPPTKPPGSRP